jgi:hypothetical protein
LISGYGNNNFTEEDETRKRAGLRKQILGIIFIKPLNPPRTHKKKLSSKGLMLL